MSGRTTGRARPFSTSPAPDGSPATAPSPSTPARSGPPNPARCRRPASLGPPGLTVELAQRNTDELCHQRTAGRRDRRTLVADVVVREAVGQAVGVVAVEDVGPLVVGRGLIEVGGLIRTID